MQLQSSQDPSSGVVLDIEASSKDGLRPVHIAVAKGFGAVLMELLRMQVDLETRDVGQRTALLVGAKGGRRVCVEMLLHAGADVTARDENGLDAIALSPVPALREYIMDWVRTHQDPVRQPSKAPEATRVVGAPAESSLVATPPTASKGEAAAVAASDARAHLSTPPFGEKSCGSSARRPSLFTPVLGTRFTGTAEAARPRVVQDSIIRAAAETAETLISPTDHWKKRYDAFRAVQKMGASDKQVGVCLLPFGDHRCQNNVTLMVTVRSDATGQRPPQAARVGPVAGVGPGEQYGHEGWSDLAVSQAYAPPPPSPPSQ